MTRRTRPIRGSSGTRPGTRLATRAIPNEVYANPGSASYQLRARTNMLRSLTASTPRWDGVNLDNVERNFYNSAGATIHGSAPSPAYPTNASWYPAVKSLFTSVGSYLRQQGFYLAGNAAVSGDTTGAQTQLWWSDLASAFDGYTQEYFEQHGFDGSLAYNGNTSASDFNDRLGFVDIAQALGKDYFGGMHYDWLCATGPACTMYDALMYGEAAFKLKWDGSGGGYRMQQTWQHRPLERRLDAEHRHPERGDVRGLDRLAARLHRRHRDRQPERAHRRADHLQPRRHLHRPERQPGHLRHPPTSPGNDPREGRDAAAAGRGPTTR